MQIFLGSVTSLIRSVRTTILHLPISDRVQSDAATVEQRYGPHRLRDDDNCSRPIWPATDICQWTDFSLATDSRCCIREILRRHLTCWRESRSSVSRLWHLFNRSTIYTQCNINRHYVILLSQQNTNIYGNITAFENLRDATLDTCHNLKTPSPPLDNIRVMVIVWSLRGNIIRTALCWIVWHNIHSPQHTYVSSSYIFNRLGLSHWDAYAVHRGGCLELYYCNMVEWFWCDSSLISTTNWFPSVL